MLGDQASVSLPVRRGFDFTPLFITGEMRSGTTLVANFLNSQPGCTVYADLLKSWFGEARKLGLRDISSPLSEREKNVLLSSLQPIGWQFRVPAFDQFDRTDFETWLDLFLASLAAIDTGQNSRMVGTKATREYTWLPQLLEAGVKIVFCIRDPRDVFLSAKNRFGDYHLFRWALRWRESVARGLQLQGHGHFFLHRFEDLLRPAIRESEIARLSTFLDVGLEPYPGRLRLRNHVDFTANSSFGDVTAPFDDAARSRWKQHPTSQEVTFASIFLQQEIKELNYEPCEVSREAYQALYRNYLSFLLLERAKKTLVHIYRKLSK